MLMTHAEASAFRVVNANGKEMLLCQRLTLAARRQLVGSSVQPLEEH